MKDNQILDNNTGELIDFTDFVKNLLRCGAITKMRMQHRDPLAHLLPFYQTFVILRKGYLLVR